ncbi:MAG: hypothetical protein LBS82_01255 [Spirochaetaceae bacterium]|jgi:hypothetical protein|nr:hypothetical protein [Spirochaetaceae bacterium]
MNKNNIAMSALLAFSLVLAACEAAAAATPQDAYTVMLYGVGDAKFLDDALNENFQALLAEGTNANVKFTAQVNYSKTGQSKDGYKGTQRLHLPVGAAAWTYAWPSGSPLKKLYLPATLSDFITWSKQTYPADKYILILDDHGGGWKPTEDYSKTASIAGDPAYGILFDENFSTEAEGNISLSSFDLAKGIQDSNTKLEMVFYSACYMNMLENLGELTNDVHYTYGANHVTTGTIFNLRVFVQKLKQGGNIVTRMDEFAEYSIAAWNEEHKTDGENIDIAVVDLTKLSGVFTAVKAAADLLTAEPNATALGAIAQWPIKKTKTANNADRVYFYDSFTSPPPPDVTEFMFVDVYQFLQYLQATALKDNAAFPALVAGVEAACRAAVVTGRESTGMPISPTTFGVNLINADRWNGANGWTGNEQWSARYPTTKFDLATGWHNVFTKLKAEPVTQ